MANPIDLTLPPLMTQGGTGASPGYSALDLRRLAVGEQPTGEGVKGYDDFRIQAQSGMNVQTTGSAEAWVRGDAVTDQGLYYCRQDSTTQNLTVSAADSTNPRVDIVVLEVLDNTHDSSGLNVARLRIVSGTASAGATATNRTGAPALPTSALHLADIVVPAGATSIAASDITDRRAMAFIGYAQPSSATIGTATYSAGDVVNPVVPPAISVNTSDNYTLSSTYDLHQVAYLISIPKSITVAKLRWQYLHGATALTGNYKWGIYDQSGHKIVETASTAFAGTGSNWRQENISVSSTFLEAGNYYIGFGVDTTNAGSIIYSHAVGYAAGGTTSIQGTGLMYTLNSGGVTLPNKVTSMYDAMIGGFFFYGIRSSLPQLASA